MPNGRVAFSGVKKTLNTKVASIDYLDLEELLPKTHIGSVDHAGNLQLESDGLNHYLALSFGSEGRMLCHGPGPVSGQRFMPHGVPFARQEETGCTPC